MRKACAGWSLPSVPDVFLVFAHVEQASKSFVCHLLMLSKLQKIILAFAHVEQVSKSFIRHLLMLSKSQKIILAFAQSLASLKKLFWRLLSC